MNIVLWILQILMALLFLFAGGTKLVIPYEEMMKMGSPNQIVFSEWFIKFIGVCELLGGLGLILPGLLRKWQGLTPLAALGLVILMIGAVGSTTMSGGIAAGIVPLVVALLCAFIAYGRWKLYPLR